MKLGNIAVSGASSQSRDYMHLQKLYGTLKYVNTNLLNVSMIYLL